VTTDRPVSRAAVFWSFAAIYVIWGSTYLGIRVVVTSVPPLLGSGTRFLLAGSLLLGWTRWKRIPAPTARQWAYAFLLGALFFLMGNGAISWAETRIPAGLTALLAATSPLFTAVLESGRAGGRRPPLRVLVGILLGLGGVTLLVAPGDFIGGRHADLLGAAAITLGALGWATGSVISHARPLARSPQLATALTMLAGGTLMVASGLLAGEATAFAMSALTPKVIFAWCYLIVFGSLIGFSAFVYLLRVSTPQKVSTSAFVNPLVAVLLGWAILGESVTARTALAGAVILGGVLLIRLGKPTQPKLEDGEAPQPAGRRLP